NGRQKRIHLAQAEQADSTRSHVANGEHRAFSDSMLDVEVVLHHIGSLVVVVVPAGTDTRQSRVRSREWSRENRVQLLETVPWFCCREVWIVVAGEDRAVCNPKTSAKSSLVIAEHVIRKTKSWIEVPLVRIRVIRMRNPNNVIAVDKIRNVIEVVSF